MKIHGILVLLIASLISACSQVANDEQTSQWKNEIIKTEKAFSEMAVNEGIPKAFLAFAAENAVLKRGNKLIIGRDAIKGHFNGQNLSEAKLEWLPDFVDVSIAGDLGYSYGHYTLTTVDSLGESTDNTGVFHTVWKRQESGEWKFVWD